MDTHLRIQELTNNSEIEYSRSKSHAKISEFTVFKAHSFKLTTVIKSTLQRSFILSLIAISRWEIAYIVDQDQDVGLNRPPTSDFRRT